MGIARRRERLRSFPVRPVWLRRCVRCRADGLGYHRLQRLLGCLTDDPVSHPLAQRHRDQKHHRAGCQNEGWKSRRGVHAAERLYPRQRPDDVELGCARPAVTWLADQMHFAQLARRHIDASGMAAKFQQYVARSIELISDEDAHRPGVVFKCDGTDFDRRRRDLIAHVASGVDAGKWLFRRKFGHIAVRSCCCANRQRTCSGALPNVPAPRRPIASPSGAVGAKCGRPLVR